MFLDSCMRRGKYIRPAPKFAFQCIQNATRPRRVLDHVHQKGGKT